MQAVVITVSTAVARSSIATLFIYPSIPADAPILSSALTTPGLGEYVLAGPVQDDVRDLEVIRPEHHHVRRAIEDRVPQLVELDVVRLRRALPGRASGFDGVDGRVAHLTRRRVVTLQRHVVARVEVLRFEPAVRERAGRLERDEPLQHIQRTALLRAGDDVSAAAPRLRSGG